MSSGFFRKYMAAIDHTLRQIGIDGRKAQIEIGGRRYLRSDRREYERQRRASSSPTDFPIDKNYFVFEDRKNEAGVAIGHYFHQDLIVAREIFRRNPERHIDVGSSIYGFVSHVASFREIDVLDVRPLDIQIPGINFIRADVMNIQNSLNESTDSVSCLHALEHFGLGRYGDSIDYKGWEKGLDSISQMLKVDGILYLSVPTGKIQRTEFNAHRVFSIVFLRAKLTKLFEIEGLSFVKDDGSLLTNVDPFGDDANSSFQAKYGCSIWILRKKKDSNK